MKTFNKKIHRIILCGVLAVIFVLSLAFPASAENKYQAPYENFFVNDYADVLTAEEENELFKKGAALDRQTTAQVVLITVETLAGEEASEYAKNIGREWGVGQKGKNNGVVILLSTKERRIEMAVGYGLEGALPDSKCGRLIDAYAMTDFKNDNFAAGLKKLYDATVNEVYIEYGIETPKDYVPIDEKEPSGGSVALWWVILLIIAIGVRIIAVKRGWIIFTLPPRGGGGFGGFGGGFSSGSGGFGGFSGGGGSFGGGGAGRGF